MKSSRIQWSKWQFVCGMSDYMRTNNLVLGYDAYYMSSFVSYEGHNDNLQQLLKSNQMLDWNIFLFLLSL